MIISQSSSAKKAEITVLFAYLYDPQGFWHLEWTTGELSPRLDLPAVCPKDEGPWSAFATANEADRVKARIQRLMAGEPVEDVLQFTLSDGTVRLALLQAKPELHPETGEILRVIGSCDWVDAGHGEIVGASNLDRLTGLYNAVGYERTLRAMIAQRRTSAAPLTIFAISLDCYSELSLDFGRSIADLVLVEAAHRLRGAMNGVTILARTHTDQFVAILPDTRAEECRAIAWDCLTALSAPFVIGEVFLYVEPVIGASQFPLHGEAPRLLSRHAGIARDFARQRLLQFSIYEYDLERRVQHNLALLGELRRALSADDQLALAYQPIRCFEQQRISHVEALLRWRHPQLGQIPPDRFLPMLEQTTLLQPLTYWVLNRALDEIAPLWHSGSQVGVCINVSPQDLVAEEFVGTVKRTLAQHNLPPEAFGVELTETQLMLEEAVGPMTEALRELTAFGIKVWLDDFGTGNSTLLRLQQLPATGLKIDRSFTQNLAENRRNRDLVRVSADLGRLLGLSVIAEGIEEIADHDAASVLGCDAAQGYLIGRPMPIDALADYLRN